MIWIIGFVVAFNTVMWMVIYFAHQESQRQGVTDYTDRAFYEPIVNAMMLVDLLLIFWLLDVIF